MATNRRSLPQVAERYDRGCDLGRVLARRLSATGRLPTRGITYVRSRTRDGTGSKSMLASRSRAASTPASRAWRRTSFRRQRAICCRGNGEPPPAVPACASGGQQPVDPARPSTFSEMMVSPSRFFSAPAKAPRTVCGCQPVAATTWAIVAPSLRPSMATSCACLVPSRVRGGRASVASYERSDWVAEMTCASGPLPCPRASTLRATGADGSWLARETEEPSGLANWTELDDCPSRGW